MSDERYIKLLTEINKYGLDKGCAVEVMAVHNATGQTVKQLCGMHEKEVLQQLIEGYLFQKEQRSKLEAENAALRERLEKAVELPCKVGDIVYCVDYEDGGYIVESTEATKKNIYALCSRIKGNPGSAFLAQDAAEEWCKELNGEE